MLRYQNDRSKKKDNKVGKVTEVDKEEDYKKQGNEEKEKDVKNANKDKEIWKQYDQFLKEQAAKYPGKEAITMDEWSPAKGVKTTIDDLKRLPFIIAPMEVTMVKRRICSTLVKAFAGLSAFWSRHMPIKMFERELDIAVTLLAHDDFSGAFAQALGIVFVIKDMGYQWQHAGEPEFKILGRMKETFTKLFEKTPQQLGIEGETSHSKVIDFLKTWECEIREYMIYDYDCSF